MAKKKSHAGAIIGLLSIFFVTLFVALLFSGYFSGISSSSGCPAGSTPNSAGTCCPAGLPYYNSQTNQCYQQPQNGNQGVVSQGTQSAQPYCAEISLGNGWTGRRDTTSTTPCYTHWTVRTGSGPYCGFYANGGGPYGTPANLWNIYAWAPYQYGSASGYQVQFEDGTQARLLCITSLGNYPQVGLYGSNWG